MESKRLITGRFLAILLYIATIICYVVNVYTLIIGFNTDSHLVSISKVIGFLIPPLSIITVWF